MTVSEGAVAGPSPEGWQAARTRVERMAAALPIDLRALRKTENMRLPHSLVGSACLPGPGPPEIGPKPKGFHRGSKLGGGGGGGSGPARE